MEHLDKDTGTMLACHLASEANLEGLEADEMVYMTKATLQRIVKTKYSKNKQRPGRGGYPPTMKHAAVERWRDSNLSMSSIARDNNVSNATIKRWITDANAVKLAKYRKTP